MLCTICMVNWVWEWWNEVEIVEGFEPDPNASTKPIKQGGGGGNRNSGNRNSSRNNNSSRNSSKPSNRNRRANDRRN